MFMKVISEKKTSKINRENSVCFFIVGHTH